MPSLSRRISCLLLAVSLGSAACGDPTDRPADCVASEYFDEAQQLCTSCPALLEPDCREGCGFIVIADERGCPAAQCDDTCSLCPEGTVFAEETLSCEPACGPGQGYDAEAGGCVACPPIEDAPSSCEGLPCDCQLVDTVDELGCAWRACLECTVEEGAAASIDEAGACILPEDESTSGE